MALDKPSGMLSVPGKDPSMPDLKTWATERFGWAAEAHRLDMSTSGLIIFALDKDTERYFKKAFQARQIEKRYTAIVLGELEAQEGDIKEPLHCDWPNRPKQMVCYEHGKPSHTSWKALESKNGCTLVALTPHTGRSHQLRVHLQSIGHPILGDDLYACEQGRALASRLLLHANFLRFRAPNNEVVELELPADFNLEQLTG